MIDSNNNRIMLIDFGIARWVNKKEKRRHRRGHDGLCAA